MAAAMIDMFQNALALLMALCMLRVRIRVSGVFFAAFSGAAAAFAASIVHLSRRNAMLLWLPVAMLMMRIAAGEGRSIWRRIRYAAVLLSCEGFLGGVVLALYGATGSILGAHMLSAAGATAVFVAAQREKERASQRRVQIICSIAGQTISFSAMVDSGNTLRDYLTKKPVIVAGAELMRKVQALDIAMRLIFADTAGGRQIMQMVMPDEVVVDTDAGALRVDAALAFSPALGEEALAPSSMLIEKRLLINGGRLSIWKERWKGSRAVSSKEM